MDLPLDVDVLLSMAKAYAGLRGEIANQITQQQQIITRTANVARLSQLESEKKAAIQQKQTAEKVLMRFQLLMCFCQWYDAQHEKPNIDLTVFHQFLLSDAYPIDLRYLLLTSYWKIIFNHHFQYQHAITGLLALVSEWDSPEQFFAFVMVLIEKGFSVREMIASKIFDYFCSVNYGVDFLALNRLLSLVEYFSSYHPHIETLFNILINKPVEMQGFASVFHNTQKGVSVDDASDCGNDPALPTLRINDPVHPLLSTNVFGQRFSHWEKFDLPVRFDALSLPPLHLTMEEKNIDCIEKLFGLAHLLKHLMHTPVVNRQLVLQYVIKKMYRADKAHFCNMLKSGIANHEFDFQFCSLVFSSLAAIVSKESLSALLETYPIFLYLCLFSQNLFSAVRDSEFNQAAKKLMEGQRLSELALQLMIALIQENKINNKHLLTQMKQLIFNQALQLNDPPDFMLHFLQSDDFFTNLCHEKLKAYQEQLQIAFQAENLYERLLQKWSQYLSAVNTMKLICRSLVQHSTYPFTTHDLPIYALTLMHANRQLKTADDLNGILLQIISAHNAPSVEECIRLVCQAMYTISDSGLLSILQAFLNGKNLQHVLHSSHFGVQVVATLCVMQFFTIENRDAIKHHRHPEKLLHAIVRLKTLDLLCDENFNAIQYFIFPDQSADALLLLHNNHILTNMSRQAISHHINPQGLAEIFVALEKNKLLNPETVELVRNFEAPSFLLPVIKAVCDHHFLNKKFLDAFIKNSHPNELAKAIVLLAQHNILNQDNLDTVCLHSNIASYADALISLHRVKLLTTRNCREVFNHSHPYSLAQALIDMENKKITKEIYHKAKKHWNPEWCARGLMALHQVKLLNQSNTDAVRNCASLLHFAQILNCMKKGMILNQKNFDAIKNRDYYWMVAVADRCRFLFAGNGLNQQVFLDLLSKNSLCSSQRSGLFTNVRHRDTCAALSMRH